jgi:hypothetical protein
VRKAGHAHLTEQDVQQYVASKPVLLVPQPQPLAQSTLRTTNN